MGAAWAWARATVRGHRVATVALVLLVGIPIGVVGAAVAAERRADGSLGRFLEATRVYDVAVLSCPPGVNPEELDAAESTTRCLSEERGRITAAEIARMPGVAATSYDAFHQVAILDPDAPNGFGRITIIASPKEPGSGLGGARPVVVRGSLPDVDSPDEIAIDERAASTTGLDVGDDLRVAGWSYEHIDEGANGGLPPETEPESFRVSSVVRYANDLSPNEAEDVSGNTIFGGELHGAYGTAAKLESFADFGVIVTVRLEDGPGALNEFRAELERQWPDRYFDAQAILDVNTRAIERAIDGERHAVIAVALLAAAAIAGFVGLTLLRQFRREHEDARIMVVLGATRGDVLAAGAIRAACIAVPAALVAAIMMVGLSPLAPVGVARTAEPTLGVRVDTPVLLLVVAVVLVFVVLIGAVAPLLALRPSARAKRAVGAGRYVSRLGPMARVGVTLARGSWPRTAAGVMAIAIAALVAAGIAVGSMDRVVDEPRRYGAWWDVSLGNFSEPDAVEAGVESLRGQPGVATVAGFVDESDAVQLNGHDVDLVSTKPFFGAEQQPVITRGRVPISDSEVALGAGVLDELGVDLDDRVELTGSSVGGSADGLPLRVVGEVLVGNPITTSNGLADSAYVADAVLETAEGGGLPEFLVARFEPGADRDAVIRRVARSFPGPIRLVTPPDDVRNLDRLRGVPWLIAAFVTLLALATIVHALVTMVLRRRHDLALLSVFGASRSSRLRVTSWATTYLVAGAVVFGIPLGIVAGRLLWRSLADSVGLVSEPVLGVVAPVLVAIAVFAAAQLVTWLATRRLARVPVAELLRVE